MQQHDGRSGSAGFSIMNLDTFQIYRVLLHRRHRAYSLIDLLARTSPQLLIYTGTLNLWSDHGL